jgi:hypothetical protein
LVSPTKKKCKGILRFCSPMMNRRP